MLSTCAVIFSILSYISARNIVEIKDERNVLDFSNMNITSLKEFSDDSLLKTYIDLSYNNFSSVNGSVFNGIKNLLYLNLTGNLISRGSLELKLFNLDTLVLDKALLMTGDKPWDDYRLTVGDNFEEIKSTSVLRLPNLKRLYLRKNGIKYIHGLTDERLPSLTHLYLSDNNIESLYFVEELPTSLTHLYLDNNKILKLKSAVLRSESSGWCTVMKQVPAPYSFGNLMNLEYLDLSHNEINHVFENSFQNLTNLISLRLDHNKLTAVPDFHGLSRMKQLDLRYNEIKHIDIDAFKNLISLQEFQISDNPLENVEALMVDINKKYLHSQLD